jgi:hypothetical protein
MPESGGTTTQAGIVYQNSVAALAMLDLVDMAPTPSSQRVTDVRVEAPELVDDIVIRYADGTATYENVKLELDRRGKPWRTLWAQLHAQRHEGFGQHDELHVVVAERNQLFEDCAGMAERSLAENVDEWVKRLTADQVAILDDIVKHVGTRDAALEIFQKTTFLHRSNEHIQDEFNRRRLAAGAGGPSTLLTTLRDIVSSGARRRTLYRSGPLRRRLELEHGVKVTEPPEWGLPAYRTALQRLGNISIPGTTRKGTVDELFVWPIVRDLQPDGLRDFEDEDLSSWREPEHSDVDLRDFPQPEFDRLVVIAGPGCGKSALLTALATRLAPGPFVPVEIPLALLTASGKNVLAFLEEHVKDEFNVSPDWERLAEQGLLVLLLDGLDEIPPSQRQQVVRRIATFSSRYEHCPWLLTARDPAVVIGLPDARQLEMTPLADNDIAEFVKVIARQLDAVDATQFVTQLKLYPDLNRLARIPLFLTMLLATTDAQALEPMKRSDLIEAYLKTLITPEEHKPVQAGTPSTSLRTIAQDIAYRKIEAQEIGVSETEVRAVIAEHTRDAGAAESTFQALRFNGILRQQGPARLKFPYPIVQEYLAACHLVQHDVDTLSSRIENAVSRPWAQVMQFAIELHQHPEPLLEEILERDDDAFFTGLRLVGRCVANGATVTAETHRRIGQRLVAAWQKAPSRAREAIGRVLCDGFTGDNLDELTEAVHRYWLQHSGAGDIVTKINDPELTLSVLKALTEQDSSSFMVYRPLRPAIEQVHARALALVRDLILEADVDDAAREARSSVLTNFEPHADLAEIALEIARNEELPVKTRLRAYALTPTPLDPDGQALLDEAIGTQQPRLSYEASCLLPRLEDPQGYLLDALGSDGFTDEFKLALIQSLTGVVTDTDTRQAFLAEAKAIFDEAQIELRSALDVMAAGAGDQAAFASLIADIDKNPLNHVGVSISLLGNYRDVDSAETAAQQARDRFTEPKDIVRLSNHAVTGMLHRLELDFGFGGFVHPAQPHPGIAHWTALVEDWSQTPGLSELQLIDVLTSASRLGADEARAELAQIVEGITDPNDPKWNDGNLLGATVGHAVAELRRRKPLLDRDFLDRLLRADQINLLMTGVKAMSAHGDRDALKRLLSAHSEGPGWHERDELANAIEVLSLKLGLVVRLVDGQYQMLDRALASK